MPPQIKSSGWAQLSNIVVRSLSQRPGIPLPVNGLRTGHNGVLSAYPTMTNYVSIKFRISLARHNSNYLLHVLGKVRRLCCKEQCPLSVANNHTIINMTRMVQGDPHITCISALTGDHAHDKDLMVGVQKRSLSAAKMAKLSARGALGH